MSDDPYQAPRAAGPISQHLTEPPLSARSARVLVTGDPDSEAPPSAAGFDGEDFLYHLYRGSELLQDNCVPQAKEELERALKLQPQDIEGQGLLGVVYFRLGLYPRAIEIYEEIIKACPNEITPRVNLGLCYFKTGQSHLARDVLEQVIQRVPDHVRAWGYLGLTFERLGELAKAEAAFEKAGQTHLARRMQRLLSEQTQTHPPSDPPDPERAQVRLAAADAALELDGREGIFAHASAENDREPLRLLGRWRAIELGDASIPPLPRPRRSPSLVGRLGPAVPAISDPPELDRGSVPPPASQRTPAVRAPSATSGELALEGGLVFPELPAKVLITGSRIGTCVTADGFAARADALSSVLTPGDPPRPANLMRRTRGRDTAEPFGAGASAWHLYSTAAKAVIIAARDRMLWAIELADEFVYVREASLLAFESSVRYENGRLSAGGREPVSMVQLSGRGFAVLETAGPVSALAVGPDAQAVVRVDDVVGWTGRMLGQAVDIESAPGRLPGAVRFSGEGALLLDLTR